MRTYRIVLAGHGAWPSALLSTAELICGPIADIAAAGLRPSETPDHYGAAIRDAMGHDHRRVLILCDLFSGTPYNVAAAIARRSSRVVTIAGANLAMVVEAALANGDLDDGLIDRLVETGREAIVETERHHSRRAS